ncbi:helix-turn-helix transcriptional regulator [Kutzneria sp. CA-103260]|uniref:helix-turn-helix transcriptional regulator n=1 Tax=Kutzneria sp. CA-103260 TaxID=2802641 RepID=UPI001BEF88E0|nr:AraC family transcriptional regulator [Kutzneria sp. CA-103260]QUQ63984.1 HTH-type transcriptional activator RhaR [Kutzneria sp. CA-103260]
MMEVTGPVRYRAGVPVYRYRNAPDTPSVSVMRFDADVEQPAHGRRHIHDFPVLVYVEQAGDPPQLVKDGDVYVLAAGAAIDPTIADPITVGRGVYFDPAALGGDDTPWSSHPLLFPFLHGIPDGLLRLRVPPERRPMWSATIAAIETELAARAEGHRQAVLAHLTLLLVDVARLATDVVGDLRRSNQTLLAEVFDVIQQRLAEPLSLRDVARSVGVTPGYLTTLVRQRTGRTVVDWITEQRMVQARRLLTDTDLPVSEIARRVGMPDPGYFARVFRRGNGVSPREWRRRTPGQLFAGRA